MSDRLDLYTPLNTLKAVADNIWIVDGPEIIFGVMPFSTRMTVIKLANNDLFVHSPTPLDDTLKAEIDALGTVKHLISPNYIHYWWVGEWHEHYPNAVR